MEEIYDLRRVFLESFIKELINNTKPNTDLNSPLIEKEISLEPLIKKEISEKFDNKINQPIRGTESPINNRLTGLTPSQFNIGSSSNRMLVPIVPLTKNIIPGKALQPKVREMIVSPRLSTRTETFPVPDRKQQFQKSKPLVGNPDLGKLNSLLSDPRVESVECPGPNKNILVKKDGRIQRTSIVLTKDDVGKTINDFSEQTRIPLVGGTFKAALGNLIMTAVTSKFVGSRFIVQKKNPFQPLSIPVG